MRIRVLGSMEVFDGTSWQPIGAAKCRAVLGSLVAQEPNPVHTDQLIDEVWPSTPPRTAPTQIHGYVMRLRRLLDDRDAAILARSARGYRLVADAGDVDALAFESGALAGIAAVRRGDTDHGSTLLGDALALWRGAPFADAATGDRVRARVERLTELRLTAIETRVDAEIGLGRHASVIGELRAQVAEHPLHEQFWRQLMIALYHTGRQAEALDEYRRLRAVLVEELGSEPGAGVRATHQQILDGTLRAGGGAPVAVRQLPAVIPDFTGRQALTDQLVGHLGAGDGDAPAIAVVHGGPGTGKSTVALRAAHQVAGAFPDAHIYLDLAGTSGRPRPATELLAETLRCLGIEGQYLPDGTAARSALLRSRLADRRTLLVLDDAGGSAQVRPLLPPNGRSAVVVTSRHLLTDLPGARHVELGTLAPAEGYELLARIAGADRVAAEPAAARAIVGYCGHLPLSIRIAGGKLLGRRSWTLEVLRARLADESSRLAELKLGDLDVRASVDLSLRSLPEDVVRGFGLLGLLGPHEFPGWVLAALLDRPCADDALDVLVDANLVQLVSADHAGQPRYRLHDLLRVYAAERCGAAGSDTIAAARRLLSAWLDLVTRAQRRRPPSLFDPVADALPDWTLPAEIAEGLVGDSLAWLDADRALLSWMVRLAARWRCADLCRALTAALVPYQDDRARYDDWLANHELALGLAGHGDLGQAVLLRGLAHVQIYRGELAEAAGNMSRSLMLFRSVGHELGEGLAASGMATIDRHLGRYDTSLRYVHRSLATFVRVRDRAKEAQLRCAVGRLMVATDRLGDARDWYTQALEISVADGDVHREAVVLSGLGELRHRTGESGRALHDLDRALGIFTELQDDRCVAFTLLTFGRIHTDLHDRDRALPPLLRAAEMFRRNGNRDSEQDCRQLLGVLDG
ncbi:AfsR/SARP family transcriptional regulator [Actinophytocola sediminis]